MALLSATEITRQLVLVPEWRLHHDEISRDFAFADFAAAMQFVNVVAGAAETAGHHPNIDIRWNKVKLVLSSHDAGGLTERDFGLARVIDGISSLT